MAVVKKSIIKTLCFSFMLGCLAANIGNADTVSATPQSEKGLYYKCSVKSRNFGDAGTIELWMSGGKFKFVKAVKSFHVNLVKNNDGLFLYHTMSNRAGKYAPDSLRYNIMYANPGPVGDVKKFLKDNDAKDLGNVTWEKKKLRAYSYTEKTTGARCKIYIDPKTSYPVRLAIWGTGKNPDIQYNTYNTFNLNATVPTSVYVLPKDLVIRPMPVVPDEKKPGKATDGSKP